MEKLQNKKEELLKLSKKLSEIKNWDKYAIEVLINACKINFSKNEIFAPNESPLGRASWKSKKKAIQLLENSKFQEVFCSNCSN